MIVSQKTERSPNILREITHVSLNCGPALCPAIFETDQNTYIVIGYVVDSETIEKLIPNRVGKGEIAIEIPKELLWGKKD